MLKIPTEPDQLTRFSQFATRLINFGEVLEALTHLPPVLREVDAVTETIEGTRVKLRETNTDPDLDLSTDADIDHLASTVFRDYQALREGLARAALTSVTLNTIGIDPHLCSTCDRCIERTATALTVLGFTAPPL